MGLDMYLSAEKYVSGYDHSKDENFAKVLDLLKLDRADVENSATIKITVGYWRKANAIHNWFVQNVQNGEDNCASYYVHREQLKELREACQAALMAYNAGNKDEAEELVSPTGGFFFGSTDIDDWYKQDLEHTVEVCDKCLSAKFEGFDFHYQSSW